MLCLVRYLVILKTCVFSRTLLPEVAIFVKAGEVEMPGRLCPLIGAIKTTQLLRQPTQLLQKERNVFLCCFQQLRSYCDKTETRNREEIPFSSRVVLRCLQVAEGS